VPREPWIKQIAHHPSHYLSKQSLPSWLDEYGVPALIGADTRAITIALREHGTIWAALAAGEAALDDAERKLTDFVRTANTKLLVASVATREVFSQGTQKGIGIVLIDCGVKRLFCSNCKRSRSHYGRPYDVTAEEVLAYDPDAVVISPGPGDPADLVETIEVLRSLIGRKPLFGVCSATAPRNRVRRANV